MITRSSFFGVLLAFWKNYFFVKRNKFGFIHPTAFVRYPILIKGIENVYLHEHTHILSNSTILTTGAKFIMKKMSGAAEGLTVVTGNHLSIVGKFFMNITADEKSKDFDKDVIVEEDVWIGTNVTLLSGVHVGRGAVLGSGTVCRKSIPPYAIVVGNPGKIIGFKFTPEEVIEHEKALYSEKERLPLALLEKNYDIFFIKRILEIKKHLNI